MEPARLTANGTILNVRTQNYYVDAFGRPDGRLRGGWTDGHLVHPAGMEPLGITSGAVTARNPGQRAGTYATYEDGTEYDPDTELIAGVGAAWQSFGTTDVHVEVDWAGNYGNESGHHVEATPLVCVRPATGYVGWGAWPVDLLGTGTSGLLLVGGMGNPVEDFGDYLHYLSASSFSHTDGTQRTIGIRTHDNMTKFTVWLDGSQVALAGAGGTASPGLDPAPLPAALAGGTLHGFEVDAHLADAGTMAAVAGVNAWRLRQLS